MTRLLCTVALIAGCGANNKNSPDTPTDAAAQPDPPTDQAPPPPEPTEPVPGEMTPASLYAQCKERVEGPGSAGECTTDADCKSAGCGGEVCTTVAEAGNVMTTCENKLCFSVLDACGCQEGQCSWSLKAEIPAGHKLPKPPGAPGAGNSLPPTVPAPAPEDAPQ